jgi:hypothetical protein
VFKGEERQLGLLRLWLTSFLPECPARDDAISVATELGSNALLHTASGRGGWFAVEVTRHQSFIRIAVTDRGSPAEPRVIEDPDGEHGRGLLLVRGLSARTGVTGDRRSRAVWAEIAWDDPDTASLAISPGPTEAEIREGEAALARRFAGVPAWFGRATREWWALAGPAGLVTAPTAQELASKLYRLLEIAPSVRVSAAGHPYASAASVQARHQPRGPDAVGPYSAPRKPPGPAPGLARPGDTDDPEDHCPGRGSGPTWSGFAAAGPVGQACA